MIRCPSCADTHTASTTTCPHCGHVQPTVNGFRAWAPDLSSLQGGFKPEYFKELVEIEAENFWFRVRNSIIVWALQRYLPKFKSFLEIGCGTGFVLAGINTSFPHARIVGSEIFSEGLNYAAKRVPSASFVQMDGRTIPYENEFDAIGIFDALEHIPEDDLVLKKIWQALKPGGGIIITVPQHNWLWSVADEHACHIRRYTATEIESKTRQAGFKILRSTSFVTLLLPAMLASRLRNRTRIENFDPLSELHMPKPLNRLLEGIMRIEHALIRMGISLPVGGSRLVVAIKEEQ